MNLVDALILVGVVGVACLAWYEGLARAIWGYTGSVVGVAGGIALVPLLFRHLSLSIWVSLAALAVVGATALCGRQAAVWLESRLRSRLNWEPRRRIDQALGGVFGVVAGIGITWMLGFAIAGSALPTLSDSANRSTALQALNDAHLPVSHFLMRRFADLGVETDFPRYVDVFVPEHIVEVPAPPKDIVKDSDVIRAATAVWRVVGEQPGTFGKQGSGFLVAPGRLMTAAHVIDGTDGIVVDTPQGQLPAQVVVCDPVHDVAVLDVPDLQGQVLSFADAEAGDPAVVVGFPGNGPLTLSAARIRERQDWQSADIRGDGMYEHDAYSVRGHIRGGDSGGPLVSLDGSVLGVVVASSRADTDTGYVLTSDQVAVALWAGRIARPGAADLCR